MCLNVVVFMMRNNSLTKAIKRQYSTKINTSSQFRFKSIKQACKKILKLVYIVDELCLRAIIINLIMLVSWLD